MAATARPWIITSAGLAVVLLFVLIFLKRGSDSYVDSRVKQSKELSDSLIALIQRERKAWEEQKDSLASLVVYLDSVASLEKEIKIKYVYIEKKRADTVDSIRSNNNLQQQSSTLSDWLSSRRQGMLDVGGTEID